MIQRLLTAVAALTFGLGALSCAQGAPGQETTAAAAYHLSYVLRLEPDSGTATVDLTLTQSTDVLRELDLNAPASRFSDFHGDGRLSVDTKRVVWAPPPEGGVLRYRVRVSNRRGGVYDARITDDWALFRLDDVFPPAVTRALQGASADASLRLAGPEGWSFETRYGPSNDDVHHITSDRLFPRPTGWAVAGSIGVRRDSIAGRQVAIAAPVDQGFRRQDTLAFLRWTLPSVVEVFPGFPARLLIVGGSPDMWRGGLSGPSSIYLHPERPLISGNGTSTMIHELVHVAVASTPGVSDDWLVEGIAEYYSLELLRRTGGISQQRFDDALVMLAEWSAREGGRLVNPSTGADTAHATTVLHELAQRLAARGDSLDEVVGELVDAGRITGMELAAILEARDLSGDVFAAASEK